MLHDKLRQPRLSAHHGDIARPNQLQPALEVAERWPEIDVFEIDFVDAGGPHKRIVSSHDYDDGMIAQGSELEQWLLEICVRRRRILWIDVKQNLDLYFNWAYGRFHSRRLVRRLEAAAMAHANEMPDLRHYVWIGCQDERLRAELEKDLKPLGWRFILDMPCVSGYVAQRLLGCCWASCVRTHVEEQFRETTYKEHQVLSIDKDFFKGPGGLRELRRFILSLGLRPDQLLVLNSFPLSQQRLQLEDHAIVMQYDYTTTTTNDNK